MWFDNYSICFDMKSKRRMKGGDHESATLQNCSSLFVATLFISTANALSGTYKDDLLELIMVNSTPVVGAVCLDGTKPGYYFRKGFGTGSRSWHVYFEGGGWCSDEFECLGRTFTDLGSAKYFSPTLKLGGVFSSNADTNPALFNWNMVYLKYCDGGSFAGLREETVTVGGKELFFRGGKVTSALIGHILQHRGMRFAEKVVIGGCSAGGVAVYAQCDRLARVIASSAAAAGGAPPIVQCYADAGMFLDIPDVSGRYSGRHKFNATFSLHSAAASCHRACLAARPSSLAYQCFFGQYSLPHIKTPFFVVNSNYDVWTLANVFAPASADPSGSIMRKCLANPPSACSPRQMSLLQRVRESFVEVVATVKKKHSVGGAVISCFQHCTTLYDDLWSQLGVRSQTLKQKISSWIVEWNSTRWSVDCPYPCSSCLLDSAQASQSGFRELVPFQKGIS